MNWLLIPAAAMAGMLILEPETFVKVLAALAATGVVAALAERFIGPGRK